MSVIQLHINRINLPYELLDIIKSYLFYDIKTYNIIQNSKTQKRIMNNLINSAQMSRANHFGNHPNYTDDEEGWVFGFGSEHPTEYIQLQAINCYYCGNYIQHTHYYELNYPKRIYCSCPENQEEYNDGWNTDDLYSDDDTDGYDSN